MALLAAIVVVAGVALGASIPGCRPTQQAGPPQPQPIPPAPATPPDAAPIPIHPASPTIVMVDQTAVDGAVTRALARLGSPRWLSAERLTERRGDKEFQWNRRRVDVTVHTGLPDAAEAIRKEVEAAGGKLLSRSPAVVYVGIIRDGVSLVTHEIRLALGAQGPRVAIIFDDAGGSLDDLEAIITLQRPVTVAVLPGLRFSREVAERARVAGLEVLLHLPLEAEDTSKALGPGGITSEMSNEEIAAVVRDDLLSVPGAIGINNHMGSKGTADERIMRAVLGVARERRLMFVDSFTSPRSIGVRLAAEMGIPTARRAVFLDNEDTPDAIRTQLTRLMALAVQRGEVIAIGHAHRLTARVLQEMLVEFDQQGIQLVPISTIVH